jgi:hypothetical protein
MTNGEGMTKLEWEGNTRFRRGTRNRDMLRSTVAVSSFIIPIYFRASLFGFRHF